MDLLRHDDLMELASAKARPCVSVYMPTHRAGPQLRQDPIRLKNLLREAEAKLAEGGLRGPDARGLLQPIWSLSEEETFWRHMADGLAVFAAPGFSRLYRVPAAFTERVWIGDYFLITPLLPLATADSRFAILALSQHGVRLLRASRHTVEAVPLPNVPPSMEETEGYEKGEEQLQVQALAPPGSGGQTATFHGHGLSTDPDERDLLRYFRRVDAALIQALHESQEPVVLAGVEYETAIYRRISAYHRLVATAIDGNPEGMRDEELRAKAWSVIEPLSEQSLEEGVRRLQDDRAAGRASDRVEDIVSAAHQGRVDRLFVAHGGQQWGRFDPASFRAVLHADREDGDADLLNLAAIQTLLHRGAVDALPDDRIPASAPMAAVFRY
jgi:hypothetical protein